MESTVACLVVCEERGSLPGLRRAERRLGPGTARMGRRYLEDLLAEQGRAENSLGRPGPRGGAGA